MIAVDSVTNKRTLYHFSKTSVANNTLPVEGSVVTATTESRNEVPAAYDNDMSVDDEYTGLPKLPVHKTIMPLPVTSSYGGVRSTYEYPMQATTSQVVSNNCVNCNFNEEGTLNCTDLLFMDFYRFLFSLL